MQDITDKKLIFIADDNPNIRQTLKDIFTEKGYLVEAVDNGYKLLTCLKESSPHIIILDLMMPTKDGLDIISAIKSISDAKIIIYTDFARYENLACSTGADKFVLKDVTPDRLLQVIEEIDKGVKS